LRREGRGDDKQRVDCEGDEERGADAAEQEDYIAGDGKLIGEP